MTLQMYSMSPFLLCAMQNFGVNWDDRQCTALRNFTTFFKVISFQEGNVVLHSELLLLQLEMSVFIFIICIVGKNVWSVWCLLCEACKFVVLVELICFYFVADCKQLLYVSVGMCCMRKTRNANKLGDSVVICNMLNKYLPLEFVLLDNPRIQATLMKGTLQQELFVFLSHYCMLAQTFVYVL